MTSVTRQESYMNMLMVYLLLFVSGSHRFMQAPNKFLIIVFIISVLVWILFTERRINDRFVLYAVIFSGFLLIINLYTGGSLSLFSVMSTTIKLTLAYLVLNIVGRNFVDTYVTIIVLLAGVSLFGYFSDTFSMFGALINKLPKVGDLGYEGFLYLFRYQHQIGRNSSIFFEPGAYQVFLNTALFMLFFARTKFSVNRWRVYVLILLTALLTTFSTTGYLIFAVVLGLVLVKSAVISTSGKLTIIGLILTAIVLLSTQFQHVILEKMGDYLDVGDITDRSNLRSFDALVDMEIFNKHVFGVGFNEYTKMVSSIGLIAEGQTSSNGITRTLAIYGLPFSLFLFGSYFFALRRLLGKGLESIAAFMMLAMFLVGESYFVFSPFCLAIIAAAFLYHGLEAGGEGEPKTVITS